MMKEGKVWVYLARKRWYRVLRLFVQQSVGDLHVLVLFIQGAGAFAAPQIDAGLKSGP